MDFFPKLFSKIKSYFLTKLHFLFLGLPSRVTLIRFAILGFLKENFVKVVLLGLVIFVFLFLPQPVSAVFGIITGIAVAALIGPIFGVLVWLAGKITLLLGGILDWVMSPKFIPFDYTNPANNPIIASGFGITQSLVNALLVIALIYVALAIALRLVVETEAKKMLVYLILVALLVNFAPVFCGLIVDGANIIMYEFLKPFEGKASGNLSDFEAQVNSVAGSLFRITGNPVTHLGLFLQGLTALSTILLIAIAFLLYILVFFLRYFIIWILVILSPLAFVALIVPATRKLWTMWWNYFLQWAIIGIPMAFFLYLGFNTMGVLDEAMFKKVNVLGVEPGPVNFFVQSLPFISSAIFLIIGFIIGAQTGVIGAGTTISLVQKGVKKGGKWAAGAVGRGVGRGARRVRETAMAIPTVSEAVGRMRRRLETTPGIGRMVGGPGAYEKEQQKKRDDARTSMEKIPDTPEGNQALLARIRRRVLSERDRQERAAAIETLAKRKELDLTPAETARFLPEYQRLGYNTKTVTMARPDYAPHFTDPDTRQPLTIEGTMSRITPADFVNNVQSEALDNNDVVFHAMMDERKLLQMKRHMRADMKRRVRANWFHLPPRPLLTPAQGQRMQNILNDLSTEAEWQV